MQKQHVVITFKASNEQKVLIQGILEDVATLSYYREVPAEEQKQLLGQADVIFSWIFPREVEAQYFPLLQKAKFIQLLSAGADYMPFQALPGQITVVSNPGAYAIPMAEHVVAMTLALAKRLSAEHEKMKQGKFDQFTNNRSIAGMTVGILGFGGIGKATAHLMRPFGTQIYAISQSGKSSEPADFLGTLKDLEKVLRASDVVVLSLPLTKETRGLIGKEQLEWMKPDSILVNVARGPIIDEEALYNHLKSHPNFYAGIDTWWEEPRGGQNFRTNYPFFDLPNVLGSPHNSSIIPDIIVSATRDAAKNIRPLLSGEQANGILRREDYI